MKLIATLIAGLFAVSAFAAEPAKKEEKKVEAKPAATAPAKAEEKKCDPAKDKDCKPATPSAPAATKSEVKVAPAKTDDKKPADAAPAKK